MTKSQKIRTAVAVLLLMLAMLLTKVVVHARHHWDIVDAICVYNTMCIATGSDDLVSYNEIEDFSATVLRWWDWSNKNILSVESYLKIAPYIGQEVDVWENSLF